MWIAAVALNELLLDSRNADITTVSSLPRSPNNRSIQRWRRVLISPCLLALRSAPSRKGDLLASGVGACQLMISTSQAFPVMKRNTGSLLSNLQFISLLLEQVCYAKGPPSLPLSLQWCSEHSLEHWASSLWNWKETKHEGGKKGKPTCLCWSPSGIPSGDFFF